MAEIAVMRRLVAILAADIAGYSRLMGEDEAATVRDLKAHQAVVLPFVPQYGGRVIDTAGDGILAEFPSLIHAVECAVEIQRAMATRNRDVPPERRMQFRIGINLGDVIHDDARIYGDGINVAARLEGIAEPGGICISSKVREELGSRLPVAFRDLGLRHLKNIAQPVHVHAIEVDTPAPAAARKGPGHRWAPVGVAGVIVASILIGIGLAGTPGGLGGLRELYRSMTAAGPSQPASKTAVTPPAPVRPFRSLAVLPFPGDGQDLAGSLSRQIRRSYPDMFVVSSSLVHPYRTGTRDPRKIGQELNVRYVVDGKYLTSPRGSSLAVELVDSLDGAQIWTGDAPIPENGAGSDALLKIRHGLRLAIAQATSKEIRSLPERERQAWDLALRASNEDYSIEGMKRAQRYFEEALRIDPDFTVALRGLSYTLWQRLQDEPTMSAELVRLLDDASARAVRLAPNDPRAWLARTHAQRVQGNINGAFAAMDRALSIDPLDAVILAHRAWLFVYAGRPKEALPIFARAMDIDSSEATTVNVIVGQCVAYFNLGRYADALAPCEKSAGIWDRWMIYAYPMIIHASGGDKEKAAYWRARLIASNPRVSVESFRQLALVNSRTPEWREQVEHMFDGLRKAGIPES